MCVKSSLNQVDCMKEEEEWGWIVRTNLDLGGREKSGV